MFYRMDPLEIAGGWVNGYDHAPLPAAPDANPRWVLGDILRRRVERSPCLVAFSGGRDSSVLLDAAAEVARREGLPMPMAVTLTYPGAPATDEIRWQQQILDHIGIDDRTVLTVDDEHDVVGPIAPRCSGSMGSYGRRTSPRRGGCSTWPAAACCSPARAATRSSGSSASPP
jgi:Asparagine synthase